MPDPKYDIVFEGRFVEGADPERVRAFLSRIFKIGREDGAKFFSGRRVVIKKGVDLPTAHHYKNLMRKAGAACRLVPQDAPLAGLPEPPPPPKPPPAGNAGRGAVAGGVEPDGPVGIGARLKSINAESIRSRVRNGLLRRGSDTDGGWKGKGLRFLGRNRRLQILGAVLAAVVVVSVAAFWPGGKPMPADDATLETFVADFKAGLLAIKTGRSRAIAHMKVAKAAIEGMGYDYDKTLLFWHFNRSLADDPRRRAIRDDYLIGPLKVLFELDAGQLKPFMAPETYATLEDTLGIGEHITLQSIRMLRECAQGDTRVPHEALVAGLQKFDIVVDGSFPEIAVEEAFYGLRHHGLIQISTRRDWKIKRVELEILDLEGIATQEKKLQQLASMSAHYAPRP